VGFSVNPRAAKKANRVAMDFDAVLHAKQVIFRRRSTKPRNRAPEKEVAMSSAVRGGLVPFPLTFRVAGRPRTKGAFCLPNRESSKAFQFRRGWVRDKRRDRLELQVFFGRRDQ